MPKKMGVWLCLFLFIVALNNAGFSAENKKFKPGFHLKMTGGRFSAAIGDINTHLGSMNVFYHQNFQTESSGEIIPLGHWSNDWDVELLWDVSSKIRYGLSTSRFIRFQKSSSYRYADISDYRIDREIAFAPQLEVAVPARLNIYYSVYSSGRINIYVHSGVGLYSVKMQEQRIANAIYPRGDTYYDKRHWSAENELSLGWQGGVSMEYGLGSRLALVAELQGRYLRINDLRGTVEYTTNFGTGMPIVEGGSLHFFAMGEDYYDMDIPLPGHAMVYGLPQYLERKAVLNLSGFSFRVGIRIRVF